MLAAKKKLEKARDFFFSNFDRLWNVKYMHINVYKYIKVQQHKKSQNLTIVVR